MSANRASVTPMPVPFAHWEEKKGHYRIRITDLVLPANIGVYEREREGPQRVRFNVELRVAEQRAPLDDDIANVLSYDAIVGGIRAILDRGHVNLVETLAEEVAALCLADPRVSCATVRVEKLDVIAEAAAVGVEIERWA